MTDVWDISYYDILLYFKSAYICQILTIIHADIRWCIAQVYSFFLNFNSWSFARIRGFFKTELLQCTVECRYNVVQCNVISHTVLKLLRQSINRNLYSQETPHISPSWTSYGVSLVRTWWHHQMETFSALLAICAGNSPVPGEFPTQRPVTRSFDVFFDLGPNKQLSKHWWCWWFETPSRPLWCHCNEFGENWPCYKGTTLYNVVDPSTRRHLLRTEDIEDKLTSCWNDRWQIGCLTTVPTSTTVKPLVLVAPNPKA